MKEATVVLCLAASLCLSACKDETAPEQPVTAASGTTPVGAVAAVAPSTPQAVAAMAAVVSARPAGAQVDGVPNLDLSPVDPKARRKGKKQNGKALKHHRKKAWDQAIEAYVTGLEADPGHILMRYNLGCAYAMNRDKKRALGILAQFKAQADCLLCLRRLERSRKDKDYEVYWSDPRPLSG